MLKAGEGGENKHFTNKGTGMQRLCEIQKLQEIMYSKSPQPGF